MSREIMGEQKAKIDPEEVLAEALLIQLADTLTWGLAACPEAFAHISWLTPDLRAAFAPKPKGELRYASKDLAKLLARLREQ
jgi:hypothetical protein